jgi:glycosyltransferase involved in cell wall biosynthesis
MNPLAGPTTLSVLIPIWNGGRYLAEAVNSVLHQGVADLEVILLVDEGSEDDSAAVAEALVAAAPPTVRSLPQPHLGLAAARNRGVSLARGRFLLHLDSDDILIPGSLAVLMNALSADPDADLVTGSSLAFVSPEIPPEQAARYDLPKGPQLGGLPGTSIVRAAFAERVGPQDVSLAHSSDLDWMIRAKEAGAKILTLPDVVLRRRIHGRNFSLLSTGAASRLKILRAALERRARAEDPSRP